MIRKIRNTYNSVYMRVPLIIKCCLKFAIAMLLCLYMHHRDAETFHFFRLFPTAAVFFLLIGSLRYLNMDVKLSWKEVLLERDIELPGQGDPYGNSDIIDYANTDIGYGELDDDEEEILRILSNLIVGMIYVILAMIAKVI